MKSPKQGVAKQIFNTLRGDTSRERFLHRLHCVTLHLQGVSVRESARIYGDAPRSVAYWIKRFKEDGVDGLHEEARSGRPSKLNEAQTKRLQQVLIQFRRQSKPLNAVALSEHIKKQFDINLTVRQCARLLKRMTA